MWEPPTQDASRKKQLLSEEMKERQQRPRAAGILRLIATYVLMIPILLVLLEIFFLPGVNPRRVSVSVISLLRVSPIDEGTGRSVYHYRVRLPDASESIYATHATLETGTTITVTASNGLITRRLQLN